MERTDKATKLSLPAQKILSEITSCMQILLLARELGADTITIHKTVKSN